MSKIIEEKQEGTIEPVIQAEASEQRLFIRQSRSLLEKIAFWAYLEGFLANLAGAVVLTISQGYPSQDIVIITTLWLLSVLILTTRMRWAPLVSTLLGVGLLYMLFTEPYLMASLSNPKGPNGGFGKFAGTVVTVLAPAIIGFVVSFGAAVQNYHRRGSRRAPRWLPSALSAVAGMVVGILFIGILAQPSAPIGLTYTNGVPTVHMSASNFSQSSVTISKGSKLMLVDDTHVTHDLFNGSWQNGTPAIAQEQGAPKIDNVQILGNSTQIGPFTTAGSYHILCTIHQGMDLTIIVQ